MNLSDEMGTITQLECPVTMVSEYKHDLWFSNFETDP